VAKQKTKPPDLCPLAIRAAIAILFSPLFRRPDFEKNFAAKSSRLSSTPRFRAASIKRLNCAGSVLFARFFFVSAFATTNAAAQRSRMGPSRQLSLQRETPTAKARAKMGRAYPEPISAKSPSAKES
jgi:hypothetical protein